MGFAHNAITSDGYNLIAAATSTDQIIAVEFRASATAYTQAQLESATASMFEVEGGIIHSASATGTVARFIGRLYNQPSAIVCKAFAIIARKQSQSAADNVVLCASSDATASIRIPSTSEAPVAIDVALNIAVAEAGTVYVTSGSSASPSDLDRFVSKHVAGDPMTGEDQLVRGDIRFDGNIICSNYLACDKLNVITDCILHDCDVLNGFEVTGDYYLHDNSFSIDSNTCAINSTSSSANINFQNGSGTFGQIHVKSQGYNSDDMIETDSVDGGRLFLRAYSLDVGENDNPIEEANIYITQATIQTPCSIDGNDSLSMAGLLEFGVGGNVNGEGFFHVSPYTYNKIYCGGLIEIKPSTGDITAKTFNGLLETLYNGENVGALLKVKILGSGYIANRGSVVQSNGSTFIINYQTGSGYSNAPLSWKFGLLEPNPCDGNTETWAVRVL